MNKSKHVVLAWIAIVVLFAVGYNNCSNIKFDNSPALLKQEMLELNSTSFIMINGGADYTNQKQVQLDLSSPRAIDMKISNLKDCSDGDWEPFSSAKVWTLSATNKSVSVYAQYKDLRGSVSPCVADDIVHDDVPPDAAFIQAPGLITKESAFTVSWNAHDAVSGIDTTLCTDPNSIAVACADRVTIANSREGTNTVSVKLTDKAGNVSLLYKYSWFVDRIAPVVTINAKPAALTGSPEARLGFTGADAGSGVDKFMCRVSQQPFQACTSPMPYSGLIQGSYTFDIYALDKAGNQSATVSAAWTVNTTAPSIRFTQTPKAATNTAQAVFGFDGTKNGAPITNFECHLDAAAFAACTSPLTLNGLSEGVHYFEFRGIDSLGNVSSPLRYQWMVDITKPVVTILTAPPGLGNSTEGSFTWTATDALSGVQLVECRVDGAAYLPCASQTLNVINLTEGSHTFDLRATDVAGNVASASRAWVIDLTPPVVTIIAGPVPYVGSLSAQFSFEATDVNGIAGFECRVDNNAFSTCASPYTATNLNEGGHVFYVHATDMAGNTSAPASYIWTLDISPPIIRIISSPVAIKAGDHAVIQYEVIDLLSGVASVKCGLYTPTNMVADCQAKATIDLGAMTTGNYTFQIVAADKVGNTITDTVAFQVNSLPVICDPFVVGGEAACSGGLIGDIYYLDAAGRTAFQSLSAKTVDFFYSNGIKVNALLNLNQLFVSTRSFTAGFPSQTGQLVTDNSGNTLYEYFAFHLNTVLKLDALNDQPGWYQFATLSDDGSMVLIQPQGATSYSTLVSNDGDHSTRMGCSTQAIYIDDTTRLATLIKYYQGPATEIAMTLMWKKVQAVNSSLDSHCGLSGNSAFFGPSPYQDFTSSGYGQLINNGWRVVAPINFIAPP